MERYTLADARSGALLEDLVTLAKMPVASPPFEAAGDDADPGMHAP